MALQDLSSRHDRSPMLAGLTARVGIAALMSAILWLLIAATLLVVDDSVSRLLATSTRDTARTLQGAYLQAQAEAVAHARMFGILLYVAGLALVVRGRGAPADID